MRTTVFWSLVLGLSGLVLVEGCALSDQTEGESGRDSTVKQQKPRRPGPDLAPQSDDIRTVQLYRGSDERSFPVTVLKSGEPLTLEFDLMEKQGRPLSIYFYHADRYWERDLSPSQVLESYQNDKLVDYRGSQGTLVPYVHYTYRLPNDDIRFRISGNYVLRVTERGRRDSVLFERPFFITDEAGQLEMKSESIMIPGQRQQSVQPVAQFDPPPSLRGDPFGFTACFVRNGRLPDTRCEDRPLLFEQPKLNFELDRNRAFDPVTADYTVNLENLRSARKVERTDRSVTPYRVLLEPDYAQFSGQDVDVDLNGQILIDGAGQGRANPDLSAGYVRTTFAFVPPKERPLRGGVVVAGSFSNMSLDQGGRMTWQPARSQYQADVLLKQGFYQYFYESSDPLLKRTVRETETRLRSTFQTFVYYEDPSRGTDRLLRVNSLRQ